MTRAAATRSALLGAMTMGCALEGGFGASTPTAFHDGALRARVGASLRTPRGSGPFAGGDLTLAPSPSVQLRSLQLRAGYAWWFEARHRTVIGVEVSMLGGLGASPYGADQARALEGYHLTLPSVALPIVLAGGDDVRGGFVVGSISWTLVPEVSLGWWFAPGVPASDFVTDVAATLSLRFWFRSDLALSDPMPASRRAP